MSALSGSIQLLAKTDADLTALGSPWIPLAGQPFIVTDQAKFGFGDGTTEYGDLIKIPITLMTLALVLANGSATGGNSIVVDNGDKILSDNEEIVVDFGSGAYFAVYTDGSGITKPFIKLEPGVNARFGFSSTKLITVSNTILQLDHDTKIKLAGYDSTIVMDSAGMMLDSGSGNLSIFMDRALLKIIYNSINGHEFYTGIYDMSSTASRVPYLDSNKKLTASLVTPTELGYLAGLTSSAQAQLDALSTGRFWKQAVRVATTAAGTLATDFENGDTIDGVVLSTGDRILIKDQASGSENGIYVVNASGAPTRATDFDASADNIAGATVGVQEGTANAETHWTCSTNNPITVGSTALTFVNSGGTAYTAGTGLGLTGNTFNITDAELLAIIGLTSAADKGIYFTGSGTASTFDLTSVARTLLSKSTTQLLIDYISQMTTLGDIVYGGASGTQTRLAGNTSIWRKKLTQLGDGSNSAAPVWANDMAEVFMTNGDQSTTSATATNITDLVFTLEPNSRYAIDGVMHVGCNNTGGIAFGIDIPTGATVFITIQGRNSSTSTFLQGNILADTTLSSGNWNQFNNANGSILLNGEITTDSNGGSAQFMFASAVGGQTSTVYQQATNIKITKIS